LHTNSLTVLKRGREVLKNNVKYITLSGYGYMQVNYHDKNFEFKQDKSELDIYLDKQRIKREDTSHELAENTHHHHQQMSPLHYRGSIPSPLVLHSYNQSHLVGQSVPISNPNAFYDDSYLRPGAMTLPPWDDFGKVESNPAQEVFGDFSCVGGNVQTSGNPLPTLMEDVIQPTNQQFTVPYMVHPSIGGIAENNSMLSQNQYRCSGFKMNYPNSNHQRSFLPPNLPLTSSESGNFTDSNYKPLKKKLLISQQSILYILCLFVCIRSDNVRYFGEKNTTPTILQRIPFG
jgi:hypothetical protein